MIITDDPLRYSLENLKESRNISKKKDFKPFIKEFGFIGFAGKISLGEDQESTHYQVKPFKTLVENKLYYVYGMEFESSTNIYSDLQNNLSFNMFIFDILEAAEVGIKSDDWWKPVAEKPMEFLYHKE